MSQEKEWADDPPRMSIADRLRAAPFFALIWAVSAAGQLVERRERRRGRAPLT